MSEIQEQVILRSDEEITGPRNGTAIVLQQYIPPLDGRSDDYEGFDMQLARGIGELLNKHYFGYSWKSYADSRQGIVGFAIPELMGPTLHIVINLKKFSDLTPDLIVNKAGELLERMNLPRDKFDMAALKMARLSRHKFQFEGVQQ